jgi:hypothetical protein
MKRNAPSLNNILSIRSYFLKCSRTDLGTTEHNWGYMIYFHLRTLIQCRCSRYIAMWIMVAGRLTYVSKHP